MDPTFEPFEPEEPKGLVQSALDLLEAAAAAYISVPKTSSPGKAQARKIKKKPFPRRATPEQISRARNCAVTYGVTPTAVQYSLPPSTVSTWLHDPPQKLYKHQNPPGPPPKVSSEIEQLIIEFFESDRAKGVETNRAYFKDLTGDLNIGFSDGWFGGLKQRAALRGFELTARHPCTKKTQEWNPEVLTEVIEHFWKDMAKARVHILNSYFPADITASEDDLVAFFRSLPFNVDDVIMNDGMGFPYEVHSQLIYEVVGKRHPWVKSLGLEKTQCTALFMFTGSRKLGVWFVFDGAYDKTLAKNSKKWREELFPDHPDWNVFFSFRKPAWMDHRVYSTALWQARKVWEDEKPKPQSEPSTSSSSPADLNSIRKRFCHLVHDRAPAHTDKKTGEFLEKLNFWETVVIPTAYLQVLDVGMARGIRGGYLSRQLAYFRDLPKGSEKIGKHEFRKLILTWIVQAFYEDVPDSLINQLGLQTGSINHFNKSQDSEVDVQVAQYRLRSYPEMRDAGIREAVSEIKSGKVVKTTNRMTDEEAESKINHFRHLVEQKRLARQTAAIKNLQSLKRKRSSSTQNTRHALLIKKSHSKRSKRGKKKNAPDDDDDDDDDDDNDDDDDDDSDDNDDDDDDDNDDDDDHDDDDDNNDENEDNDNDETEKNDDDEDGSTSWVPEVILREQWAFDSKSPPQRQYFVKWKCSTHKDLVEADEYDKQWPRLVSKWQETCKRHGDEFPMPCPQNIKLTSRKKFHIAQRSYST